MDIKKRRIFYIIATIALFAIEVLIALFVHDRFIRPYFGDVLVVILIYTFIRMFVPDVKCIRQLPLYVFIFAVIVEFLQYIHIVDILGVADIKVLRIIIGTGFSWIDIICYACGCIAVWGIEKLIER